MESEKQIKIAGTVVLYNPTGEIISNLQTYLPLVERLYVMDNSDRNYDQVASIKALAKIVYVDMQGNQGIAKALKTAAAMAMADGYDLLLTMDQDSKYPTEQFGYLRNYLATQDLTSVGIVTINYTGSRLKPRGDDAAYWEYCNEAISSGMIINLANYRLVPGFREELFIDLVDLDLCGQFLEIDCKIVLFRNIFLCHHLGEKRLIKFLFLHRKVNVHSPLRYYYMYRNKAFLLKLYRKHKKYLKAVRKVNCLHQFWHTFKVFLKNENHLATYRMIKLGRKHGKQQLLGRFPDRLTVYQGAKQHEG